LLALQTFLLSGMQGDIQENKLWIRDPHQV